MAKHFSSVVNSSKLLDRSRKVNIASNPPDDFVDKVIAELYAPA